MLGSRYPHNHRLCTRSEKSKYHVKEYGNTLSDLLVDSGDGVIMYGLNGACHA